MLKRFFIVCSGADKNLLKACSEGEQTKYVGIGATVFFTAIMAFLASSYALFTVFNNGFFALMFGFVWALLIFNLDRFIVSTIRKKNQVLDEFIQATPRILLAIIIAIVISKPLEIKIFEKEINTVLLQEKNAMLLQNKKQVSQYFQTDVARNTNEIDQLKKEIALKEKEVNDLYETYIKEAEGTAGTKKLGKGPVFKEKIAKHDTAKKQLDSLRQANGIKIAEKEKLGLQLQKDLDQKVAQTQPIIDGFDGLMARINALNKLPKAPSIFIMLLFLAIETSPIIAKLLAQKSQYDFALEDAENIFKSHLEQEQHQRDLLTATNKNIHTKVYETLDDDAGLQQKLRANAYDLIVNQDQYFFEKQRQNLPKS